MARPLLVSMTSTLLGSGVRQSASVGAAGAAAKAGPAMAAAAARHRKNDFMAPA